MSNGFNIDVIGEYLLELNEQGPPGAPGLSIESIAAISFDKETGVYTYRITYNDGSYYDFEIQGGVIYTFSTGLSVEDKTVSVDFSEVATAEQGRKADTAVQPGDLATVATTGSYDDLLDKPTIPDAQVQANWNESDVDSKAYIQNKPTIPVQTDVRVNTVSITNNGVANLVTKTSYNQVTNKIATVADLPDTTNMQTTTNLVTSLSSSSTDAQYPSAKCVYDLLGDIETLLQGV